MKQDQRVVIITGGAKGIGRACTRRFVESGLKVIIADIDEKSGTDLVEELGEENARFICCDICDKLAIHNLVAEAIVSYGQLDVLVNNAGILIKGNLIDLDVNDFDRVMNVNLRGAFLMTQAVSRVMLEQIKKSDIRPKTASHRYAIINISSVNSVTAIFDQLAYVVSKGGLNQLTRSSALELAPYGIRVNAVAPANVNTDSLNNMFDTEEDRKNILTRTPLGRVADPDEIASIVAFLASKEASYITGQCIYADGGRLALGHIMNGKKISG